MALVDYGQPPGTAGDPIIRTGGAGQREFPIPGPLPERIAQVVCSRYDAAESYSKAKYERFYRYEKIIAMLSKRKTFEWKANAYLPYALAAVEQSAASKFLQLFQTRPFITVIPRQNGLEDIAKRREALLDWQLLGDVDILSAGADMFRMAERYGKAVALCAPDWDTKVLRYRSPVNIPTVYGPIARIAWKTDINRAFRIRFEPLDLTDVKVQPGFRRINGRGGMRYIMRDYWLTIDELRQLESLPIPLWGPQLGGQPTDLIRDTQQQSINEFKARRLMIDKYDDYEQFKDQWDRMVHIIEYQGDVPNDLVDPAMAQQEEAAGLDPKKRIIALANKKVVGINQAMPWDHGMKSYIEMDCIPNPHDFYGTGKVEPIEHLVYVGNEIMNMRIDNVKAAINGLIGVDGSRMPAGWKRRLVSQPWGVLETLGPPNQVVERLQLGDVTASSYQEQQQVYTLIQEAIGMNETALGAPGGPVRTLGEHQLKFESGARRINFELWYQAQQLFGWSRQMPGLTYFILQYCRQYMSLPQYTSVVDPLFPDDMMEMQIDASTFAMDDENFIYQVTGSVEGMNKGAKRADFVQLMNMMGPLLQVAMYGGLNVIELIKSGFRVFDLDPNRFFPPALGAPPMGQYPGQAPGAPMMGGGPTIGPQPGGLPGRQPGPQRPEPVENRGIPAPPGPGMTMPRGVVGPPAGVM